MRHLLTKPVRSAVRPDRHESAAEGTLDDPLKGIAASGDESCQRALVGGLPDV
jgi:hypothetical protein